MAPLAKLRAKGLMLRAAGNQVLVEPCTLLTDELRALIRQHKPEILETLSAEAVLEGRRRQVEERLRSQPALRRAFDIAGAPLTPEPGPPVSLVLAVRTDLGIVSGELHVPREKFDAVLIIQALEAAGRPS